MANDDLEVEFRMMVETRSKPGEDILASLTPEKADLLHAAVGIAGEAGELLDAVKKHVIYNQPLDEENVREELGDLEFYMERLRKNVGLYRFQTLLHCTNKLNTRYASGKYSDDQARDRADKNG